MLIDEEYKQFLKSIKKDIGFIVALATKNSVARRIILYVYEYELKRSKTNNTIIFPVNLTNQEFAKKLNVSSETIRSALHEAKKTGLITITGSGRARMIGYRGCLRLITLNTDRIADVKKQILPEE